MPPRTFWLIVDPYTLNPEAKEKLSSFKIEKEKNYGLHRVRLEPGTSYHVIAMAMNCLCFKAGELSHYPCETPPGTVA